MQIPSFNILGIRLQAMSRRDLVNVVAQSIREGGKYIIANHNLHSLYLWFHEPEAREFYSAADYIHVDGMSMILIARLFGLPLEFEHRTGYVDLLPLLAAEATRRKWRIFYLGSKPGVAEKAAGKLRVLYPGLQICTHHGHFDAEQSGRENQDVLAEINNYDPDILMVGMGMPRQEIWVLQNREYLKARAIFCCGALMDYVAGEIPTPPRWLGPLGLEWLYRLLSEPTRLWRRYLVEPWSVLMLMRVRYLRNSYLIPKCIHLDTNRND
jgi:N-acetylglucosaminyldiphosphoundecaprenol N-acetyl-beta-D-mannosaminyltransferase